MSTRSMLGQLTKASVLSALATSALALGMADEARADYSFVTATGTALYVDDRGVERPIKGALVEMCDEDYPGCQVMASTMTGNDGRFNLSGGADDWAWDKPDPRIRVTATGPSGTVRSPESVYCFMTAPVDNAESYSSHDFGRLTPSNSESCNGFGGSTAAENGAWQLHGNVQEAWSFVRGFSLTNPGREVLPVSVKWPVGGESSYYRPPFWDNGEINITQNQAFNEAVVMHEYGHHVLQQFGEQPLPDYNNGRCDSVQFLVFGGHCFWHAEKGSIAWTEGWASYLAEVLTTQLGMDDTVSSAFGRDPLITSAVGSVETPAHPHPHESPSPPPPDQTPDKIEGYVTAVLWDLHDTGSDVHGPNFARDRLAEGFGTQWDVLANYDPDPFVSGHNRITDIHEFWKGVADRRPDLSNRLSEIYDLNHISEQAADLHVPTVSEPPASVYRGGNLPVTDTTANMGGVQTGTSSVTRYWLSSDASFGAGDVSVGQRTVGNLGPAQESSGSTTAIVPTGTAPGRYFVLACADGRTATLEPTIFETNDLNNCRSSWGQVEVKEAQQPPPALTAASVSPTSVPGGGSTKVTVSLAGPAPAGGVVVTLTDNSAATSVPASVTVPAGSSSVQATVTTTAVASDTGATITAAASGVTKSASMTVLAPRVSSLSVNPNPLSSGASATLSVGLSSRAAASGFPVNLQSSNPGVLPVPSAVTVPSGGTSATSSIRAATVSSDTTVAITASAPGGTRTVYVTVLAPRPSSLSLSPAAVESGAQSIGTLTLDAPAPAGGLVVNLQSNTGIAWTAPSVTVAAGATTATFPISTGYVGVDSMATISASANGVTRSASLTVFAPPPPDDECIGYKYCP